MCCCIQSGAHDRRELPDAKTDEHAEHNPSKGETRDGGKNQRGDHKSDSAGFGIAVRILLFRQGFLSPLHMLAKHRQ